MNGHQKQREQSVRMIEEALFALMQETDYDRITVSEIVSRAEVSRRTFYRLYKAKDEVLRCYFDKMCQKYCMETPELGKYDIRQISMEYFCYWYRYRDILLILHKSGTDELLYQEISRVSAEVIKSRIMESKLKNTDGMEYFADYSTGGFLLLLKRWITGGMKENPRQYAENVSDALLKFIRPASG